MSSTCSTKLKTLNDKKTAKSQHSRDPPQGYGKMIKDHVKVHNRYGHLHDSVDESVWNRLTDDSSSAIIWVAIRSRERAEQISKGR
jgi:hypothetical protein